MTRKGLIVEKIEIDGVEYTTTTGISADSCDGCVADINLAMCEEIHAHDCVCTSSNTIWIRALDSCSSTPVEKYTVKEVMKAYFQLGSDPAISDTTIERQILKSRDPDYQTYLDLRKKFED